MRRAPHDGLNPRRSQLKVASPNGDMYAFFQVPGQAVSLAFAKHLVAVQGLGLAPGVAFGDEGDEGEGWPRWCFTSRDPSRLTAGVARLAQAPAL